MSKETDQGMENLTSVLHLAKALSDNNEKMCAMDPCLWYEECYYWPELNQCHSHNKNVRKGFVLTFSVDKVFKTLANDFSCK